jgi:hypothetical protein
MKMDQDGASRLAIGECSANACKVLVPLGIIEEGKDVRSMHLLDKFLASDSLLILYMKDGKPYDTMVLLASFKKEYQRVLTSELK